MPLRKRKASNLPVWIWQARAVTHVAILLAFPAADGRDGTKQASCPLVHRNEDVGRVAAEADFPSRFLRSRRGDGACLPARTPRDASFAKEKQPISRPFLGRKDNFLPKYFHVCGQHTIFVFNFGIG